MNDAEQDDFLKQIVAFQVDGLSEAELADFDSVLFNDEEKRRLFIETQRRSVAIADDFRNQALTAASCDDVELARTPDSLGDQLPGTPNNSIRDRAGVNAWKWAFSILIAATLLLAGAFQLAIQDDQPSVTLNSFVTFAKVTYSDGAVWRVGEKVNSDEPRQMSVSVPYELVSGKARLEMHGGGIVTLAAPALFRGLGPSELELLSGKIAARMPTADNELTIRVGELAVRDFGTAFGITAESDGAVDLSVFEGSVAVEHPNDDGDIELQRVRQGNSIVRGVDSFDREVPFNPSQYDDVWPLTIGIDDASSLIKFTTPGPQQPLAELADNSKLLLIPEQLNKSIRNEVSLKLLRPGKSWPESSTRRLVIEPGMVVSSYLLVYIAEDTNDLPQRSIRGSVSFQKRILGVVIENAPLQKSDKLLGGKEIDYGSLEWRYLERDATDYGNVPPDAIAVSPDGRHLFFDLHVSTGHDCIRVLVDEGQAL